MDKIKMIITDLDGTLLHNDHSISEYTKNVLFRCQEQGIKISIATARYWIGAERYITELKPDYEITTDGTLVHNANNLIYGCGFYLKVTNDIIHEIKMNFPCSEITVATGQTVYWNSLNISNSDKLFKAVYNNFSKPLNECGYKIVAQLPSPDFAKMISENNGCKMISYRDENWYSFVNYHSGKIQAIKYLLNKVNIELENVVAFGDDVNDIEMLNECGFGIAVANAVSGVKQIANEITDSNNEDGVAKYIEKYIL
jgi:5-amino-6-(5-phospho-D-ribitylamino)uracil phosphatase